LGACGMPNDAVKVILQKHLTQEKIDQLVLIAKTEKYYYKIQYVKRYY
jgi:hypothetical protein